MKILDYWLSHALCDRVVREMRLLPTQRDILAAVVIRFVHRSNDAGDDSAEHAIPYRYGTSLGSLTR